MWHSRCSVAAADLGKQEIHRAFHNQIREIRYDVAHCILSEIKVKYPDDYYGYENALVMAGLGDKEQALDELNGFYQRHPRSSFAYANVANVFVENEMYGAARQVLHEAINNLDNRGPTGKNVDTYSPKEEAIFLMAADLSKSKEEKVQVLEKGLRYVSLSEEIKQRLNKLMGGQKTQGSH